MSPPKIWALFLFLLLVQHSSTFAGDRLLPPADIRKLEEVGHAKPHAEAIISGASFRAELEHHSRSDGFRGRIVFEVEVLLRSRSAVQEYSRLSISSSDIRHLDEVQVEVRSLDGMRRNSFSRDDLEWIDVGRSAAGIVSLDTEKEQAVIPTLRVGDLLYLRQVIKVKGMHGLPVVTLGNEEVPVLHDAYVLSLPDDHELKLSLTGDGDASTRVEETILEKGGRRISSLQLMWDQDHAGDVVRVTPQVVTVDGKTPSKSFTVGASWPEVGQNYRKRISEFLTPNDDITDLARELTATCETDSQRASVLYDHLQNSTRYLGFYDGLDGIIPEKAESVYERGYGDCKGLAAYLIAMLTAVGIESHPVLVRTDALGPLDPGVPNMTQFNHMIAWADVGEDGMWLDATVDHCPAGMIISQDTASDVLLLRSGQEGLYAIPAEACQAGTLFYTVEGGLDTEFNLECNISLSATGLAATWQRSRSGQADGDLANAVERWLMPNTIGMRMVEHGAAEMGNQPHWTCLTRSEVPLPHGGGAVFMPAILPPMPQLQKVDDVSKQPDRREEWTLTLPPGWSVAEDEQNVEGGAVNWHRRVWQEEGRLRLVRELTWQPASEDTMDFEKTIRGIVSRDSGFLKIKKINDE